MERDGYYIAYAIGTDLTEWDNAQAALIVTEINAMDWFFGARVTHTKPVTEMINPMTAGHVPKSVTVGRTLGRISTTHYLQTSILTYAVMGASTAVAAEAERDITKGTTTTPINIAFHLEKEGTTANRRKDIMGVVPNNLSIRCDQTKAGWIALQTYTANFTFTGAGANLAQPTALVQATHPPFTWGHYKNASGSSSLLYNTGAVNVDIIGFTMTFGWEGTEFGTYDSNGYPNTGLVRPPFYARVTIDCKYVDGAGTDIQAISDLDPSLANGAGGGYAGDLDLIIEFYEDATNYIEYTFDDMKVDPGSFEEVFKSQGEWFDGFRFDLVFRNETSALTVKSKDALGDTYYTNP